MAANKITGDLLVTGEIVANNLKLENGSIVDSDLSGSAAIARTKLAQDTLQPYNIPLTSLRVWDSGALLPTAGAADDLGLIIGTFATEHPHLSAGDLGAAGATSRYARGIFQIPAEYDDAETVNLRVHAGMQTALADVSCTVDVELHSADEDTTLSAELCSTAAQSMNSLTFANYDFVITATSLVSGTWVDYRITVACNDAATAIVEPTIGAIKLLCDVRG